MTDMRLERSPLLLKTLLVGAVLVLCTASVAHAKLGLSFGLSDATPAVHQRVVARVRSDFDPGPDCRMKLLAVAPGANKFRALDAFLFGKVGIWGSTGFYVRKLTPSPHMGFLVSMKQRGPKTWRVTIRFPRAGSWRLIVPNECDDGYRYPTPIDRVVTVR